MKYSEVIKQLNYWKELSEEEDPEVVVFDGIGPLEIDLIEPTEGVDNDRAIGIFEL